jgi:polysaccharide biosynthesis/export protein
MQYRTVSRFWTFFLLLTAMPSWSLAQQKIAPAMVAENAATSIRPSPLPPTISEMLIGPGDLLEVSVYGAPDFDKREVRVDSAGTISLPLIGPEKVGGLTVRAAEELTAKRLSDAGYFSDPHVSIFEKEYATQGISVLGEVQKPGIYPLLGQHTLLDVISAAGGTTAKAGEEVTLTHRGQPQTPIHVSLSYSSDEAARNNVAVYPGDTVVVAKAGVVYVVGDVRQPAGFVIDKSELTVLQAIAMAQGTNPTAALDRVKLVRTTSAGREESPINLKRVLEAKAPDLKLQADDIIFVPTSTAKSATRRGLEAIVQTATGVAIYRR